MDHDGQHVHNAHHLVGAVYAYTASEASLSIRRSALPHTPSELDLTLESLVGTAANQAAVNSLLARIAGGGTALFAGAGVAVPAGFPSWPQLLEELEGMCDMVAAGFVRDERLRDDDPLVYTDSIKAYVTMHATGGLSRYESELAKRFGAIPHIQPIHEDLVSLPFRAFLTTNYDRTLQTALAHIESEPSEKSVVVGVDHERFALEFLRSLSAAPNGRLVAHIHGWYKQPSSIILSASDYVRAYGSGELPAPPFLIDFLKSAVSVVSLVFVGFSFNDQHFGNFLASTGGLFRVWGSDAHYALIPTTPESAVRDAERAAEYRERYAVETVFYNQYGSSHRHLDEMIAGFRDRIGISKRLPAVVDFNQSMVEGMRG